jgi:uncharacterized RDD family membrane protein YckC
MNQKMTKPNYFNKALASFIDFILPLLCCLIFSLELNFFILFFAFRLISIYLFDSTIGMKVCKLTFLNANEEGLSIKEKILASFFILFEGVDYYKISRVFN